MKYLAPALAPLLLIGCASAPPVETTAAPARAGIGQTAYVDGIRVTPLEVLEDSRCPKGVQCVWAGRVRLNVRVNYARAEQRELELGKPVHVADGALELVEALPAPAAGKKILPEDYRFGFRFMGGL